MIKSHINIYFFLFFKLMDGPGVFHHSVKTDDQFYIILLKMTLHLSAFIYTFYYYIMLYILLHFYFFCKVQIILKLYIYIVIFVQLLWFHFKSFLLFLCFTSYLLLFIVDIIMIIRIIATWYSMNT